jgi:hypothetical protein
MQRRPVLAGAASLLALGGCLEIRSLDGGSGDDSSGDGGDGGTAGEGSDGVGSGGDDYESGTMSVTVDGEAVDLTADRFQAEYAEESIRFHFHEGDEYWYVEGKGVTFAEAIDLLPRFGFERTDGAVVVTVDGTTYDAGDAGITVAFRANGEAVDPTAYDVQDGDHLALAVTTGG